MPNAAPSAQQAASSNRRSSGPDEGYSVIEYSSGADSDNDPVGSNGSGNARALKRKRPLTVSYVRGIGCASPAGCMRNQ